MTAICANRTAGVDVKRTFRVAVYSAIGMSSETGDGPRIDGDPPFLQAYAFGLHMGAVWLNVQRFSSQTYSEGLLVIRPQLL
jgi:hypothetical protein